ncbi:MAG: phage holin family protein [Methanobacteriota archaeon]
MDPAANTEEEKIESEFIRTIKLIDLYMQQKTDLFLQHYVFEPVDLLLRQIMFLSVAVTFLAAGTVALVTGVILFIATIVPLWAALLITGTLVFGMGGIITYIRVSKKIVLKTPRILGDDT